MDHVPLCVDQNIVVVPIFDLENVLDEGVASQRFDEISNRFFPVDAEHLLVNLPQALLL